MIETVAKVEKQDGYKKTRLGCIPDEWQVKKLSDLTSKIGSGTTPLGGSKVYTTKGHPFIRSQNIGWGRLLLEDIAYIPDDISDSMSSTELQLNDVLLNITGASIGRSALVNDKIDKGNVNQHVCIIRVNKSLLNERFLNIFLISRGGQKQIEMLQAGGNRQGLNFQQIGLFKIPLPSINEQKNIVEVISSWDEAISKTEKLIQAKKQYKKGLMQRLLSGNVRFPEFEGEDWIEVKLGEVFTERNEKGYNDLKLVAITTKSGIIDRDELDRRDTSNDNKSNYKRILPGDIGYNTMRMWQGVSGYSELKGIVSPAYTIVTPITDKVDGFFMSYLFKYPPVVDLFRRFSQGLVSDTLNLKFSNFSQIKLKIPPSIKEQEKIASVFTEIDKNINLLEKKAALYQKQKEGLMQKLLTGKVRVNQMN